MVSRTTGSLRKFVPAVAAGLVAVLVGCGAGQVTQTDSIEPAVNGNRGDVGPIALRNVMIAYPDGGDYREGDDAPLVLTIVNTGDVPDELVAVTSPAATGEAELVGNPSLPPGVALHVVLPEEGAESSAATTTGTSIPEESITEPSAPAATGTASSGPESSQEQASSAAPDPSVTQTPTASQPDAVGTISVVLKGLVMDWPAGRNFPVTFVFAEAGEITIQLPIASPATPRADPTKDEESAGH